MCGAAAQREKRPARKEELKEKLTRVQQTLKRDGDARAAAKRVRRLLLCCPAGQCTAARTQQRTRVLTNTPCTQLCRRRSGASAKRRRSCAARSLFTSRNVRSRAATGLMCVASRLLTRVLHRAPPYRCAAAAKKEDLMAKFAELKARRGVAQFALRAHVSCLAHSRVLVCPCSHAGVRAAGVVHGQAPRQAGGEGPRAHAAPAPRGVMKRQQRRTRRCHVLDRPRMCVGQHLRACCSRPLVRVLRWQSTAGSARTHPKRHHSCAPPVS
jgi:hypothetical protein